ncbi:piggyBac transposable element-derived protein 4-like [Dreissena polymorpha]|uniref:piggyBac transposable element-derived protein 4-like n=1 Tax=Dreissena polymorpha TaxID=45954 RepID=UPI002264304D|nr:piggyBac transposable element-derived protein 4-like [Dreissena polymorpha]
MREFTEQSGPQLEGKVDPATGSPLDYFFILFPLTLLQLLVVHTNAYATFCMARDGLDSSWAEVTETEMRAFPGINILMVQRHVFWTARSADDHDTEPIRQVIDTLLQTFRNSYVLSRDVAVDEAMIGYTGRLSFRRYMPAKPIKRGIKCWMLCDSRLGYLTNFEVYLGRDRDNVEHGLAYNVVMRLTRFIRNTFRWVSFDNFFTGLPLVKSLLQNGLYSCGTVRCNRKGFPQQLKKPAALRQRGDSQVLQLGDSNITASVWMDRKPVHHLSSK